MRLSPALAAQRIIFCFFLVVIEFNAAEIIGSLFDPSPRQSAGRLDLPHSNAQIILGLIAAQRSLGDAAVGVGGLVVNGREGDAKRPDIFRVDPLRLDLGDDRRRGAGVFIGRASVAVGRSVSTPSEIVAILGTTSTLASPVVVIEGTVFVNDMTSCARTPVASAKTAANARREDAGREARRMRAKRHARALNRRVTLRLAAYATRPRPERGIVEKSRSTC